MCELLKSVVRSPQPSVCKSKKMKSKRRRAREMFRAGVAYLIAS